MRQIGFSFLVVLCLLVIPSFSLHAHDENNPNDSTESQSYQLLLRCGVEVLFNPEGIPRFSCMVGYATPIYHGRYYVRVLTGISSVIVASYFFHTDAIVDLLNYGISSVVLGLSIVKPFDDMLNLTTSNTSVIYDTHKFFNTLHVYAGLRYDFHPSSLDLFTRIPFTNSMYTRYPKPGELPKFSRQVCFGITYQYAIKL